MILFKWIQRLLFPSADQRLAVSKDESSTSSDKPRDAARIQSNAEMGLMFDEDMPPPLDVKDCHSKAEIIILGCLKAVKKTSQEKFDQYVAGENGRYINIYQEMSPGFMRVESLLSCFHPTTDNVPDALNTFYALTFEDKENGPVNIGDHLGCGAGAMMGFCGELKEIIDKNEIDKTE